MKLLIFANTDGSRQSLGMLMSWSMNGGCSYPTSQARVSQQPCEVDIEYWYWYWYIDIEPGWASGVTQRERSEKKWGKARIQGSWVPACCSREWFLSGEDTCLSAGRWDRHQRSSWDNRPTFIFLLKSSFPLVKGQKSTLGIRPVKERIQKIWEVRCGGGTWRKSAPEGHLWALHKHTLEWALEQRDLLSLIPVAASGSSSSHKKERGGRKEKKAKKEVERATLRKILKNKIGRRKSKERRKEK